MVSRLIQRLRRHPWLYRLSFTGSMGLMIGLSFYLHGSSYLFPGPLSGTNRTGKEISGVMSHADLEKDCLHCHAPVHCITDTRCQDCHIDIARQREEAEGLHSRLPGTDRCQTCHPEHQGQEASITVFAFKNVDHTQLAGFSLEKHQTGYDDAPLNCASCHTLEQFGRQTLDCVSCHTQADHDYMSEHIAQYGLDCLACHDGRDRMTDFDHEQIYPLDGAHADVPCEDCHLEQVYVDTPAQCSDCHQDPEIHLGMFGLDCARCHSIEAWSPAYLTEHTFFLDHGGEGKVACETCHTGTYAANSCYGCHEDHQPDEMIAVHLEEGITNLENCAGCHPTGQAGEARELQDQKLLTTEKNESVIALP